MNTAHLYRVIQDVTTGKVLAGAEVTVCNPGTTTAITEQLYSDEALSSALANPFASLTGKIDVYLASPKTVSIKAEYAGKVTVVDYVDVLPDAENLLVTLNPVTITNDAFAGAVPRMVDTITMEFVDPATLPGGSGSGGVRATATATTTSLAAGVTDSTTTMTLGKGFRLYSIVTSKPARVRLYETAAQKDADAPRAIGVDPTGNSGVIFDYVTAVGTTVYTLSPLVDGANLEASPTTAISMAVTNMDVSTGTVTVTLVWIQTEG